MTTTCGRSTAQSGTFMFTNLLLLLDVAFIPFPTKLVADFLQRGGERSAVIAYAATLLVMALLYTIWWRDARTGRRLIAPTVSEGELRTVILTLALAAFSSPPATTSVQVRALYPRSASGSQLTIRWTRWVSLG
jgi:hypothetical protein